MCLEAPRFDFKTRGPEYVQGLSEKGFGLLGGRSVRKAGSASFACVSVQRELADQQQLPAKVQCGVIEPTFVVGENPEVGYFFGQVFGVWKRIGGRESNEDDQTGTYGADDFVFNRDRRRCHPLDQGSQLTYSVVEALDLDSEDEELALAVADESDEDFDESLDFVESLELDSDDVSLLSAGLLV